MPPFVREIIDIAVGDDQVRPTVQLGVKELRAKTQEGETGLIESGLLAGIHKHPQLGQLQVQGVVLGEEVGHVQVQPAVAIGIVHGDPHARLGAAVAVVSQSGHGTFFLE